MYYRTKKFTWAKPIVDAMLNALSTRPAAALLVTPKLVLFTAPGSLTPDTLYADLTLCTFHGYADAALTLAGPVSLSSFDRGVVASAAFIATSGGTVNDTVLGYAVTDGAAAFYGGEIFPAPMTVGAVGAFIDLDLIMPLPDVYTPTVV